MGANLSNAKVYAVAVVGFNTTERVVLESIFGLSARRDPSFTQFTPDKAEKPDLFLLDGDDPRCAAQIRAITLKSTTPILLMGTNNHGTAFKTLPRPLMWTKVLKAFEEEVGHVSAPRALLDPMLLAAPSAPLRGISPANAAMGPNVVGGGNTLPLASSGRLSTLDTASAKPLTATSSMRMQTSMSMPVFVPGTGNESILVVDDSVSVRKFIETQLAPTGLDVDYVESGEQAIGQLTNKAYACVLLDVILPGIDGYHVCKIIKAKKKAVKTTGVVMLSSKASTLDRIRGSMAGCDAYLPKPVSGEQLFQALAKFLPAGRLGVST